MATEVVMPQMGESVAEGTIVRWLKHVGDRIERDEPLFEISTDKVDAEIPSPAAGVIAEIRHREGETVPIHTVVAIIGGSAGMATDPSAVAPAAAAKPSKALDSPLAPEAASVSPPPAASTTGAAPAGAVTTGEGQRLSPVVKKIAQEYNVDVSRIQGTGIGGRVTKRDILFYIGQTPTRPSGPSTAVAPSASASASTGAAARAVRSTPTAIAPGTTAPMSVMRKRIAEHMVLSKRTSAHVHSVFEINCHRIDQIRQARKDEFARAGAKLTYLSFIIQAAVEALRAVPVVNASVDVDNIVYHKDVNIGIAVALDWGLIVPVVKRADEKSLMGISRAVADLAARARAKKLSPEDVQGGTFTITNPGGFGAQFGLPIINQPQVAIMAIGAVEKRVVVIDDAIAIRPMAYFSLGYDHRIIDGATADEFMSHVKRTLENWDPNTV
jgi:2-oxoglutarate dehydrogenase E2 component (dihydrolipoamide succinyltransferase)